MSWRDRLQPASLRGVPFFIDAASGQAGRRVAVHEYPQQEVSWAEDLGKKAGQQTLQAFVIGPDYDMDRDALFEALDKSGPSTLVHPYLGTLKIQVTDYDWTISTRQGGYCKISINYVPAGKREYPSTGSAHATALQSACDNAATAVEDSFSSTFDVDYTPAWISDAAFDQLTDAIDIIRGINGQLATILQPLSTVANEIDQLGNEVASLILQPRTLVSRLQGVLASVLGDTSDVQTAFAGYTGLMDGWGNSTPVNKTTPYRKIQAKNHTAVQQLLTASASIELARQVATTRTPFATYDQAVTVRDRLLDDLDTLIESGDDTTYYALVELQTRLMRRVDYAASDLLRIDYVQIASPVPALVFAHQVYGDATRADELVSRNSLADPNFVPSGTDIEVLL